VNHPRRIEHEAVYPHARERVWRALVDPAELAAWLMPTDFAPDVGHEFSLQTGDDHIGTILGWELPEARLLLRDLTEHATQREFVYRHAWRVGDLVIWDNRATMHRARPFDDTKYRRELRRVTTLDIAEPAFVAAGS